MFPSLWNSRYIYKFGEGGESGRFFLVLLTTKYFKLLKQWMVTLEQLKAFGIHTPQMNSACLLYTSFDFNWHSATGISCLFQANGSNLMILQYGFGLTSYKLTCVQGELHCQFWRKPGWQHNCKVISPTSRNITACTLVCTSVVHGSVDAHSLLLIYTRVIPYLWSTPLVRVN